jgi:hypothetical protein
VKKKNRPNMEGTNQAAHVSAEAILRHLSKGLNKQEAARLRGYRIMLEHNIALSPKQLEDYERLKVQIHNNLKKK